METSVPIPSVPPVDTPRLLLIGVDHRCAPLELREKVSYDAEDGLLLMRSLAQRPEVEETVLLSTCNRTELYLLPGEASTAYRVALEEAFLSRAPEIEAEGRFYVKRGLEAAQHLFEVASGLQSMVLGEPEILGQVKQAAGEGQRSGGSGPILQQLLERAVRAGGRVRRETALGQGSVSFGYAVVDLARNIFSRLESCRVLLVGAGEMSQQVARALREKGVQDLAVCNRGTERLEAFRQLFPDAKTYAFGERHHLAADYDVVVASTGADEPVLKLDDLRQAVDRRSRPLLAVDLGVPRNIDPASSTLDNFFLQDIDSLDQLIQQNLRKRREEVPRAQEILDGELLRFQHWHQGLAAEPLIANLQRWAESLRQQELQSMRKPLPDDLGSQVDAMTRSLVRKLLHHPSITLRRDADAEGIAWTRRLFQLDDGLSKKPEPPEGDT